MGPLPARGPSHGQALPPDAAKSLWRSQGRSELCSPKSAWHYTLSLFLFSHPSSLPLPSQLIRSWTLGDVKAFHRTHYRPDNAHLYIVGDVDVGQAEEMIRKYFGHLEAGGREQEPPTLKLQSRHFPPVTHYFSGGKFDRFADASLPAELKTFGRSPRTSEESVSDKADGNAARDLTPRIFQHENIQAFSFHLFAKRPIEAVQTLADYRRSVMKRIAILALQIRLNVLARDDPPFTFIEFNQLDSAREACAVCNLDVLAEPEKWEKAVSLAVREIRRLGMYGLSESELNRSEGRNAPMGGGGGESLGTSVWAIVRSKVLVTRGYLLWFLLPLFPSLCFPPLFLGISPRCFVTRPNTRLRANAFRTRIN